MIRNIRNLLCPFIIKNSNRIHLCELSSSTAAVTRIHRSIYERMYPTVLVLHDGSSINIRYHEPRKIIKLPLDVSTLSESERKARIDARKPKKKLKITEEFEDNFNSKKYLKFIKKKK